MAEPALFPVEARGLVVRFRAVEALRGVDLTLEPGRKIAVLGANGAGKSVLLRVLHGLMAPSEGEVRWAGSPVRPRAQAMVFQRPVLLRRSVIANVEYALHVNGITGYDAIRRAHEVLDRVGLDKLSDRPARALSGGEQQRLALARAWALAPRLLFLDEPTASLDPAAATQVERIVSGIHADGATVVLTTHNLGLARRFAHDIAFLHEGRITERTPADRFFTEPASAEAGRFLQGELPWSTATPAS